MKKTTSGIAGHHARGKSSWKRLKKIIIRSGPHVLRFYVADGWSRDAVESLLESGHTKSFDLDKIGLGYFVAMPGSMFHRQNLMDACAAFFPANARGHEACPAMMIEFF